MSNLLKTSGEYITSLKKRLTHIEQTGAFRTFQVDIIFCKVTLQKRNFIFISTGKPDNMLKIEFSEQGRLLASCRIQREKFYPGPGIETGTLALHASALTTELLRISRPTNP